MSTPDPNTRQLEDPPRLSVRSASLRVLSGPDTGASIDLDTESFFVGTSNECRLRLTDPAVSRKHFEAQLTDDGLKVRDCESTNGTFDATSRLTEAVVPVGGIVRVGETRLLIATRLDALEVAPWPDRAFGEMRADSPTMRRIFALARRVAATDFTVLILGETGSGKDALAREIHRLSPRATKPFVVVDCGAIAGDLIESELFGHEKGSFTGAVAGHAGAFERAQGGTVMLDEVGELPLGLQPKLLRALDERTIQRVGGTQRQGIDVRFIAATHRNLKALAERGAFRQDLFFRLSVATLTLPPLRERPEDISVLIDELMQRSGAQHLMPSAEALELLRRHDWPGNVRELRNAVERAAAFNDERALYLEVGEGETPFLRIPPRLSRLNFKDAKKAVLDVFEREYLRGLLERCEFNFSQAAREADLDRNYVADLARKHGLAKAK